MTEIERRLKQAEENEKARQSTGKGKTSTQTGRSAASSSSGRSDTERRLRIAEEQNRKYSASAANRRAALQRKTESFMEATTEAEPEARAAIDRYKAYEDAKYYAAMNQRGAAIGDDAMLERGRSGYEKSSDQWRASYDKGPQASQPVVAETPERAARNRNYWAEAAKQAAQFGDQARYGKAMENVAEADRDARNASALRQKEYERQLDALRQSNPAEYYALTKSDDEIDQLIAYYDYGNRNEAGRAAYVNRTPEEEAEYLNNLRRARFAGESDAERAAYIRAEQERYETASKSYENRRTVMDNVAGKALHNVTDDPSWIAYFERTPEEQAEYLNNLRRARFAGESDAERAAYIQGEQDRYAEQFRNYQNGPEYSERLEEARIRAGSTIEALERAKAIHELERVDKSPANIEAGRAALREQQGHLLKKNKFYYDEKTMSRLATGAGPADSRDYQEMIDKGWVLYSDFYELPAEQQNNVYAAAAKDPEKAVSLAQHYLKLADDEHYQKIYDWVNKDSGWQFGRRALGMVGGAALKLASGLDPYGSTGQSASKTGNALISGGAASAARNGLFGIEALGGDESGISSDVPFIGRGQAGITYQVGASVLQSAAIAAPAMLLGNYSEAAAKVAEVLGTTLMGSSAAADDYTQCIQNGMTVHQARMHATAAGIAEAAFEYISLDKLVDPDLTTSALKRWLQQAGIEASEEVVTSIANRISDELLADHYGIESAVERRTRELMAEGLAYNAARGKAENEWLAEITQDGMSGFLSGLIMGGGSEIMRGVETFRLNRANRNTQTPTMTLQQDAATDSAELPGGTEQATVGAGSVQQNAAEAQNQQSTEMEQGRSDAQYMETDELDSAVEHWDGILESARGENNQEIIDRYAGYVAGLKQVQQERADLNQRRIEAGDDLGLAEGLGRVGVEQVNPGQAATGSQADYGGQRMPATAEQNGGMNHERIQGGSQIGGDSGQIARAADDGQLAARTAGPADSGQRNAGLGTGEPAGGLGEGTGSTAVRNGDRGGQRAAELAQLKNYVQALGAERKSAREIGIRGGTKNAANVLIQDEWLTDSMRQLRQKAEDAGIRLDFVLNKMETRSRSGRVSTSSGIFQFDADGAPHVFIQADSKAYTPQQLFDHELFHSTVAANKGLWQDMVDHLYQTHTKEEITRMVDAYVQAYDGCYGTEEADVELYLEEIFADVYAEMRRGGGQQQAARKLAGETAQRFAGDIENARQNRAGIENRNGPGTRFVYSEEEAQEMQDEGITVTSGPSALDQKADKKPVSQVLAESVSELENMQPLAHLTGHEMNDRSKTLDQQIREWFASFGNVVSREAFGDILFQEYGVGGVMNHKPLNRAKLVTLIAAKDVVVHGKVISYEENHKGRGYPSYIFAGPVTIGPQNTKIYVAAVVDVRSGNKFYFNECVDSAGNYVRINEGAQGNTKTGVTVQDGVTRRPSEPSINNIAQNSEIDKRQGTKNSEDDATVDWNGNREEPEARLSAADEGSDTRFSAADADDDSLGVDWIGSREENGGQTKTQAVTETDAPHPSPAATPSPEGEGSETGGQNIRTTENAQAMAREKKVSIAEKASIEGLKSRIDSAETRLRALNDMESTGLLAKDEQTQKEWKQQIKDVQESLDIYKKALEEKKEAKKAEKADKAKQAEKRAQRKQEKKALAKEAELQADKPRQARKEFRQDALNLFSVPAAKRQTLGNLLNRFADTVTEKGNVSEADRRELFRQLYEAGVEVAQPEDYYKDIRDFVKSGRVYVPEDVRAEFGDDWDAFRKRAWGNGIYLTNDQNDRGADVWNTELAEVFPGSFDPSETDARNMLENIVDLAEEGKAEFVSIEEMMRRNQDQYGVTVDQQMDELEQKVDHLIDTFAQKAELEQKVKKAGVMQLVKERQKNRELAARQVQRKRENEMRKTVADQVSKLQKMRKRVRPDFQGKIDELIGRIDPDGNVGIKGMFGVIDTQARSISPQGLEDLPALARQYEEYKKAKGEDFIPDSAVEKRINRLKEIQLDSLTLDDVITLGEAVSGLVTQIQNENKLLADERHGEVSASAGKIDTEVKNSRGKMIGERFWAGEMLDMPRYIQHLTGWKRGGEGERFANLLQKATTEESAYISSASALFDEFKKSKENLDWLKKATGRHAESIEIKVPVDIGKDANGNAAVEWQTFEITPMMRVALLMHSRNYENLQHIAETGIEIPKLEDFRKGKMEDALSGVDPVRMAPSTVKAIVKDCTPQERAFANVLAVYFDVYAKEKINNVSLQLDGFYRANVEHYFPIDSARDYLGGGNDYVAFDRSLESISSLKERKNGINPIVLGDALDIASRHMATFARYTAFAIPMRDFNEVFSYVFHEEGNPFAGSVMHTIGKQFGPSGPKSIKQIQAALAQQNPASDEVFMKWLRKIRGRIASASLSGNVKVMISQFASLPNALPYLDAQDLLTSFVKPVDTTVRDICSPISQFRRGGYINQELGDLKSEHPLLNSIPVVMTGITDVDTFTINRLWSAAVNKVYRTTDLKPGTREQVLSGNDEFYQKVAEIYEEAVYKTQPNYTTVQRPALLRDSNDLLRSLFMYKTVPFQVYGMLAEATERLANDRARYQANKTAENEKNLKASWKFFRKTQVGVLTGFVLYVTLRGLIGGGLFLEKKYRDEEGKMTLESVAKALGRDLIDTYAGSFVGASELLAVFDKATGNSSYNNKIFNDISSLGEIEKAANVFINSYKAITEKDWQQGRKAIKDAAQEISVLGFGFPAKNIEKFLLSTTKWIAPEWADRYENYFDEYEHGDLDEESRRFLEASVRVLMDNRTDGLSDDTIEELSRLWENEQTMHIPSGIPTSIKVGEEEKKITASMREDYRDAWNKVVSKNLEQLLASDAYEDADDKGKAKLIAKLYDYARQQAEAAVTGRKLDAWVEFGQACEAAGIPLTDYLTVASVDKDNLKDMDGEALDSAIRSRMEFRVGELDEKTLDELGRLFSNGASGAIPSDVPTSVSVSGEDRKLTPEERVAWLQAWKRIAGEGLEGLIRSGAYKTADDAGKAKMLSALYDMARASASSEVVNGYAPDKWVSVGMEAAERGVPIDEYAAFHVGMSGLKTAEKLALLKGQSWSDNQKEFIWTELMATDTQYSKYQNLKNAGMKWADAMEQLGIGAASTTPSGLTDAQQAQYDKYWNEISGPATQQLLNNADYKKADKATQAAFLDRLNDYAARVAKAKVLSGYDKGKWVECGERLTASGVKLDEYIVYCAETSDANNRAKYNALAKTGWTDAQKLTALEYISASAYSAGKVGRDYQIPVQRYLEGLTKADADDSGNINQGEAEEWLDRSGLDWESKAYLWQMLCYSSKWKNNPYSTTLGEDIWHSLHPDG